jgi:hypothetical protein
MTFATETHHRDPSTVVRSMYVRDRQDMRRIAGLSL